MNPEHVAYCGQCGCDLDKEHARHTPSGEFLPSWAPNDAYFVSQGIDGGRYFTRYGFWMATLSFFMIFILWVAIIGHLLAAGCMFVLGLAMWYFAFRAGREGAGRRS